MTMIDETHNLQDADRLLHEVHSALMTYAYLTEDEIEQGEHVITQDRADGLATKLWRVIYLLHLSRPQPADQTDAVSLLRRLDAVLDFSEPIVSVKDASGVFNDPSEINAVFADAHEFLTFGVYLDAADAPSAPAPMITAPWTGGSATGANAPAPAPDTTALVEALKEIRDKGYRSNVTAREIARAALDAHERGEAGR
jgi:hypothetical protein